MTVKKRGKGRGGNTMSLRRSAVTGDVSPKSSHPTRLAGHVSLKVYRRVNGAWRMASGQKLAKVGPQGKYRTRLGRFGRRVGRPGTYRVRAHYLGGSTIKPSASRFRKFKVRSASA